MTAEPVAVDAVKIADIKGIDPIHVFWMDDGPGRGYVTIICYGAAWTAYFGAMGDDTIREFVLRANVDYLVTKLGIGPHLKSTKRADKYLEKILNAVKEYLGAFERQAR